ncbi:MAG TPA: ImmA/IrrE family metallo-endopeptidase [Methylocystis sp.]|nr:ImmA/IrrE family metallo-endopeptidase [Methylocystis sp.]
MSDDFLVDRRSDSEVCDLAKKLRDFFGFALDGRVDIVACLKSKSILTVKGVRPLDVQILPDEAMGTADGLTALQNGAVLIQLKQSVVDAARMGDGRARNTIAHEFGHGMMHDRIGMARRATSNIRPGWMRPFESAEHQAKVFAPAFLINDVIAKECESAEEVSIQFGVSLESARIFMKGREESEEKERSKERIRRMADEFIREVQFPKAANKFLDAPCTQCGRNAVYPVGSKFTCALCGCVFDRYQDGDAL